MVGVSSPPARLKSLGAIMNLWTWRKETIVKLSIMSDSNINLGSIRHSFPVNFLNSSHDEGFNLGVILVDDVLCCLGLHTKIFSPLRKRESSMIKEIIT